MEINEAILKSGTATYSKNILIKKIELNSNLQNIDDELASLQVWVNDMKGDFDDSKVKIIRENLNLRVENLESIKDKEGIVINKESEKRILENNNGSNIVDFNNLIEDYRGVSLDKINRIQEQEEKIRWSYIQTNKERLKAVIKEKKEALAEVD